jgi:UDP-N-acetylmuramate dehydrogenase
MLVREQVSLAPLTTLGVGGAARYFVEAAAEDEVREAVAWARARRLPLFVLGGGSNLVVSDGGFPGLVVKIAIRGVSSRQEGGQVIFSAAAGEDWDSFVATTVQRNCAGLECLSGIPGLVGGTPVQNVGAYGQEVGETIQQVEVLEISTGAHRVLAGEECGFAYRASIFNAQARGQYIILRVEFALQPGGAPRIAYEDLQRIFAGRNPALAEVRETVRRIRSSKGMLLLADDPEARSAGSFFRNPVLSAQQYEEARRRAAARGLTIPCYAGLALQHKVPAAWLVEHSGFPRGYARGPAAISRKHALAIVNRGGATAADIMALGNDIRLAVRNQFGVELEPEPVFVGE